MAQTYIEQNPARQSQKTTCFVGMNRSQVTANGSTKAAAEKGCTGIQVQVLQAVTAVFALLSAAALLL